MHASSSSVPNADAGRVELTISNRLPELARVTAAVDALALSRSIPEDAVIDMKVALDDVLSNLIAYGFDAEAVHQIHVVLSAAEGSLEAQIKDDGVAFDLLSAPVPAIDAPLEERPIGGLGIHLVRSLMTELEYRQADGWNVLRMVRRFP